ncbi:uncharacterized protein LOC128862996 [Anastrepha ludens]|uniref:uncharacterized protein LOC128862996 n=1 Tax=Anastrepha ludens TaxID=28586 RepID=UPI0023B1C386|nr:uncharacterized protein LOC128862996 [Anastrepha ludens]
MSSNKNNFTNFKEISKTLSLANSDTANIAGIGNVRVVINEEGKEAPIKFEQVMYVPDLRTNLLSVSKITEKGFEVIFKRDKALIIEKVHSRQQIFLKRSLSTLTPGIFVWVTSMKPI